MNNITQRLKQLNMELEESISYEDMDAVEEVRRELGFLIEEMELDFPFQSEDF